ncbi:unnamed protein product [Lupinus luteus]|uniref:Uncharacterized protein n=1 Tax=Lupinus luteus TaxID=3873 RepID=A0AAV1VWJ8_LUPLU
MQYIIHMQNHFLFTPLGYCTASLYGLYFSGILLLRRSPKGISCHSTAWKEGLEGQANIQLYQEYVYQRYYYFLDMNTIWCYSLRMWEFHGLNEVVGHSS